MPITVEAQERDREQTEATERETGKLEEFGEAGNSGSSSTQSQSTHEQSSSDEETEHFHETDAAAVQLIADILYAFVYGLITAPKDTSIVPEEFHTFSQYPYFEKDQGLYKIGGEKDFSMQVKANYYHESSNLMGGGLRLRLSPLRYFSAEAYLTFLSEQLRTRSDRMMLASFFLNYHLIRQNTWAVWLGLGDKLAYGPGDNRGGLAGNLTLEIYPFDPISFHANLSSGAYRELYTTVNYHVGRSNFFVGYHGFFAGSSDLEGIVAGSSFYF